MLLATIDEIPGRKTRKTLGLVCGTVTRAASIRDSVTASLKGMLGGEVEEYTRTIAQSREQALDRMRQRALELGANAVVGVRFATAEMAERAAEIVAYGTAVVIDDDTAG